MGKILNAAVIGLGGMGRGHLNNYIRFTNEGDIIKLVAACDIDASKFGNEKSNFNIEGIDAGGYDFSKFHCYTDMDEMLEKEELDLVTVALPTYMHADVTCKILNKGINVFCEKPMSLHVPECQRMIDTAKANGKKLMIGQVLRFWGEYEVLKSYFVSGKLGAPVSGYYWRGGGTPTGSYQGWYLKRECSGGCIKDQHVHDVDMVQYLYGMPKAVQTNAKIVIPGSGYDMVSTNYIFDEPMAVNAQDDWTLSGLGFEMAFRVNFTEGSIYLDNKGFRVCPKNGEPFTPEFDADNADYKEIRYFANSIINGTENTVNPPEASLQTIRLVEAENESADKGGIIVNL